MKATSGCRTSPFWPTKSPATFIPTNRLKTLPSTRRDWQTDSRAAVLRPNDCCDLQLRRRAFGRGFGEHPPGIVGRGRRIGVSIGHAAGCEVGEFLIPLPAERILQLAGSQH